MPFYDVGGNTFSTNGTPLTENQLIWGKTAANQEVLSILGLYISGRLAAAGGGQMRMKTNTGTTASGGTANTPNARNARADPAAQSSWADVTSAITAGTTLKVRDTVGFAATGGQAGITPVSPGDALRMMPNATNPIDVEFTTIAGVASIPFEYQIHFAEGPA